MLNLFFCDWVFIVIVMIIKIKINNKKKLTNICMQT